MARFRLTNPLVTADSSVQQNFEGIQSYLNRLQPVAPISTVNVSSTTGQGPGGAGTDVVYTQITATLTTGTWLVYGQATLIGGGALDGMQLRLYNNTAGADIADSSSPVAYGTATGEAFAFSTVAVVPVTGSSMDVRLKACRNGGSTVAIGYGGGSLTGEQRITAIRIA